MTEQAQRPIVLSLHAADNVGVAVDELEPGQVVVVGGDAIAVRDRVPLGHKLALADIPAEGAVRKLNFVIGVAKCAIARGAHVHMHNLRSAYITNFTDRDP